MVGFDQAQYLIGTAFENGLVNAQFGSKYRVLVDVRDFNLLVDADVAGIRHLQSHDDFHQGGLAGTIDAHKGYFLALVDAEGYILEQLPLPK